MRPADCCEKSCGRFILEFNVNQMSTSTMIHRPLLAISFAFAAIFFSPVVSAQFQPSQRYPDPLVRVIDPSFTKYRLPLAKVEKIAAGMRWAERARSRAIRGRRS